MHPSIVRGKVRHVTLWSMHSSVKTIYTKLWHFCSAKIPGHSFNIKICGMWDIMLVHWWRKQCIYNTGMSILTIKFSCYEYGYMNALFCYLVRWLCCYERSKHTLRTIVSWCNPKQNKYVAFGNDNDETKCIYCYNHPIKRSQLMKHSPTYSIKRIRI